MNFENQVLSPHREMTGDFMLCRGCRIARIGSRTYPAAEMPEVKPIGPMVTVVRDGDSLFNEETIRSFEGVPLSLNHPPGVEMFTASTWLKYIAGCVFNVRKGEGDDAGCLVADIKIYSQDAIKAVLTGEASELSLGFTSEVKDAGGGIGVEGPLKGNHVALVPRGRCGAMCSVKDGASTEGEDMFFNRKDAAPEDAAKESGDPMAAVKALSEQVQALSEQVAALQAARADADDETKPGDPTTEANTDEVKTEDVPKTDEGESVPADTTPEEKKAPTIEEIAAAVAQLLTKQSEATESVKKDAATVAPSLPSSTPNLAMAALGEYAKTQRGAQVLSQYGGIANIRKDAASDVLKTCALVEAAVNSQALGRGRKDAASEAAPSFFEQAKKLWN